MLQCSMVIGIDINAEPMVISYEDTTALIQAGLSLAPGGVGLGGTSAGGRDDVLHGALLPAQRTALPDL